MRTPGTGDSIGWRGSNVHCRSQFLRLVYTRPDSLYTAFRPPPISWKHQNKTYEGFQMDVVFIGAIVVFLAVSCGFAAGCGALGERK